MSYLLFECGGRYPETGDISSESMKKLLKAAAKNERIKLMTYSVKIGDDGYPIHPYKYIKSPTLNGKQVSCLFCPANKRKAGRREIILFDPKKTELSMGRGPRLVTCKAVIK